ncbi:MAG: hypothetical protein EPO06_09830 [Burkholderiaceae bacterium]|nr:MAG: hypothetical protein EPO06_09830 [Burkholderiaceae bacterium]
MGDFCGRLYFAQDMNGDGIYSITDIWLLIEFIWLLPAKLMVTLFQSAPAMQRFFEINCDTGESWGGGIFSFFAWALVFILMSNFLEDIQRNMQPPPPPEQKKTEGEKNHDPRAAWPYATGTSAQRENNDKEAP